MFEFTKQVIGGVIFGHECQYKKTCTEYSITDEVCGSMGRRPERPGCYENTCKEIERCPSSKSTGDICYSTNPQEIPLQKLCWEQTTEQHMDSKQQQAKDLSAKTTSSEIPHQQ